MPDKEIILGEGQPNITISSDHRLPHGLSVAILDLCLNTYEQQGFEKPNVTVIQPNP